MNHQLAKEAEIWKSWSSHSRPSSPEARSRHSNEGAALNANSTPQRGKQPTSAPIFSRCQTTAVCSKGDALNHRTVEDRMRDWVKAEQTITTAFFLMWVAGVTLLGGWHVANQF
ncbi:hypothetical protein T484DRAFT_1750039 [Baffinella frigidus]|nr:hypothetical protein T484DRAFT_1750039 [Cryptophyta sp. CCMP2293]